jgi:multicomponent K+:H+ antiporter subunit G
MNGAADLPLGWALVVAVLLIAGALFALAGAVGLARFQTFYQRVHAPTLGSSMGMVLILLSSILYFSLTRGQLVFHEVLIAVFLTLTTPISLMLVVRAALARDRLAGDQGVPPLRPPVQDEDEAEQG